MKCITLITDDAKRVEPELNAWFQANPHAVIFTITQIPHGNRIILTTIYYS